MRNVRPFCGLRYNLQRVTDPLSVISPPYDVISEEQRLSFHARSPHNIIRLEYGQEHAGDSEDSNKYTRAAGTLDEWLRDGILTREEQPALYIVEHRFQRYGITKSRWGLICGVRLADYGSGHVRPHEQTTKGPAIDRLHLLRACRANFSPIMGLIRSENGEVCALWRRLCEEAPEMTATDDDGVTYNLWAISDSTAMDEALRLIVDRTVYIADGHHRYETALRYKEEQLRAHPSSTGDEPFNFVMMSLMDSQDPGLLMLPTHRMLRGLEPRTIARLEEEISPYFRVEDLLPPLPDPSETIESWLRTMEDGRRQGVLLGLYGLHGCNLRLLRLRQDADLARVMSPEEVKLWSNSDVFILQQVVLRQGLGLDTLEKEASHLQFTRDAIEAASRVDSGEFQLAFFLNPAPVSSMLNASDAGKRLPQKSTYFHPKTPAGLVINPVWDD
jgi:uncharacterized protein (DUF1015 family)